MSTGYSAGYADVVEESFVRRIVGKEVWSRLDAEIAIAAATGGELKMMIVAEATIRAALQAQ